MIGSPTTLTTLGQCSHRFVDNIPLTMIKKLYRNLLHISAFDRIIFVNAVKEMDTILTHAS